MLQLLVESFHLVLMPGRAASARREAALPPRQSHAPETQSETRSPAALPRPEAPFLSTSEQHGVQGGLFPKSSDVQCSDPGAVELKEK